MSKGKLGRRREDGVLAAEREVAISMPFLCGLPTCCSMARSLSATFARSVLDRCRVRIRARPSPEASPLRQPTPQPTRLANHRLWPDHGRCASLGAIGPDPGRQVGRVTSNPPITKSHGQKSTKRTAVENLIRPIALKRKNALFAGHDEGAAAWGRIASLIETAKLNGVNSHDWLRATLEAIAGGHPNSRLDELLPWNFDSSSS